MWIQMSPRQVASSQVRSNRAALAPPEVVLELFGSDGAVVGRMYIAPKDAEQLAERLQSCARLLLAELQFGDPSSPTPDSDA